MTRRLIIIAVFWRGHASQLNGTNPAQCKTETGWETNLATDGEFIKQDCGNLKEFDCCTRCFDQMKNCVAVDLQAGCCRYYKTVAGTHESTWAKRLSSGSTPTPPPSVLQGPTKLSDDLNQFISWAEESPSDKPDSVYTGGKGILVRNPFDGYQDDQEKTVVPATFWVNDIMSPSQLYPGSGGGNGNPWCPTHDAPWSCDADGSTGDMGPWNYVQMAVVVGSKMKDFFHDFENIQHQDWGWGVFYASDSNAVDQRCLWFKEYNGYDCPGGWLPWGEKLIQDTEKKGAGGYPAGNPNTDLLGGGGAGCHFSYDDIDQTNAVNSYGDNLMMDENCQCNYNFQGQWDKWVDNWVENGLNGKSYSWAVDIAMCWMNNVRDMINLQNALWWKHRDWNNQKVPIASYGGSVEANRPWWGWNEIPVNRDAIADIRNWDAIMIKLPTGACGGDGINDNLDCLDSKYYPQLEADLKSFVDAKYLGVGQWSTPSSNVIIAREYMDASENFFREFFCQQWTHGRFQIVFKSKSSDGVGACYLDYANSKILV